MYVFAVVLQAAACSISLAMYTEPLLCCWCVPALPVQVSLVLEFCDWGSLRTALDAGAFFAEDNSLNYAAILDTAADVAKAMLHLHKNHVGGSCWPRRLSCVSAHGCVLDGLRGGLC